MALDPLAKTGDAELVRTLIEAAGDATTQEGTEAARELWQRYHHKLIAYCSRLLPDRQEAEDVIADIWISVFSNIDKFNMVDRSFASWLFAIARNRTRDSLRRRTRAAAPLLREDDVLDPADPALVQEQMDIQTMVQAAIEDLPAEVREVVIRHYLHGQSLRAIASELDLSEGNVSTRIRRARTRLQRSLVDRGVKPISEQDVG